MPLNDRSVGLVVGQRAAVARDRLARDRVQPARPDVVAERVPGLDDVALGRRGQRLERRIAVEPLVVLRQHAIDLRLLQHDLGDEDVIRIARLAPRQVASVPPVPGEQPAPKPLAAARIGATASDVLASRHGGTGTLSRSVTDLSRTVEKTVPIYTKTGDAGETGLFDGTRVSKSDPRVAAYGDVDELNAWLGARARQPVRRPISTRCSTRIQRDLFALGARLADPRHKIAARVDKATLGPDDVARLERLDRHARRRAAAAAPLHPGRRLAGRRDAAPGAHVCRRAERRHGRARRRPVDPIVAHVHQSAVRSALRDGARRQPPRRRARNRVVADGGLRALPAAWRASTTRTFPSRRGCCRRPCARTSPPSTRSRASPTTSPTRAPAPTRARLALLDDWRAPAARRGRRARRPTTAPTRAAIFIALGETIRRVRPRRRSCSTICSARFARTCSCTRYETWDDVLDYCRRSANPVGRLVLRIAGYRDARLDAWSDAVCTALQLTNFWQDLEQRLAQGPAVRAARRGRGAPAPTSEDLDRRRDDAGVARRARRRRRRGRARCFDAGRPGRRRRDAAACAGSCARRGSAACAFSTGSRPRGFDVFRARPDARLARRRCAIVWRTLLRPGRPVPSHDAARRASTTRFSCCRPPSGARSSRSSTSAARSTTASISRPDPARAAAALRRWRDEVARVFDGAAARDAAGPRAAAVRRAVPSAARRSSRR